MRYKFEIHEKAIGKERPRYSAKAHRMYTPARTSSFEEKVKVAFLSKYNIQTELSEKPFRAVINVYYKPSKSLSKKKQQDLLYRECTKRPDCDNIAKAILDALNGIAYKDDSQISSLSINKSYEKENKIEIALEEIVEWKDEM